MTQLDAPTPNPYAELVQERFSLPVSLLRKDKNGKTAFAPCVVLSESMKSQVKKKAYSDTLKSFDGKPPKIDEPGVDVWKSMYDDNYGAWTIYYSTRVPGDLDKHLFLSKDQITNDYSSEEIGIMFDNYQTVMLNQRNIMHLSPDDPLAYSTAMDAIIKQNTITETAFFFNSYTTVSVAGLVRYLIEERQRLLKLNGLSGMPSSDISENEVTQS